MASESGSREAAMESPVNNNNDTETEVDPDNPKIARFLKVLTNITVEPIIFLSIFAQNLVIVTNTTFVMERVCRVVNGHTVHVCSEIFHNPSYYNQKVETQEVANNWLMINQFVVTVPGVFLAILTGPWSDKYGRKPPIIIPLIGNMLSSVGMALMAHFVDQPPYVIILVSLPSAMLGGYVQLMSLMSYITDVTTTEERSAKFVFIEGFCFFAFPLGGLVGGYIYKAAGFLSVYVVAAGVFGYAALYCFLFVKETQGLDCDLTCLQLIRQFPNYSHAKECFSIFCKPRVAGATKNLLLLLTCLSVFNMYYGMQNSILYMYTEIMFSWSEVDYSVFQSVVQSTALSFNAFIAPILTYMANITDSTLGVVSSLTSILCMIIMALATRPWMFYLGGLTGLTNKMLAPISRSMMTKYVISDETGKLFAFVSSVESFVPALGSLIFSRIYNSTVRGFPSASLFLAGFLNLFPLSTFLYLLVRSNNERK